MIDKMRGRRRIAALASSALVAGALAMLPGVAGLSAASGASASNVAYTCDITMSGGFASYGGQKAATLTLDTDAPSSIHVGETSNPALTYTLTLDPTFAAQFGPSPIRWMQSTLTGATKTGAATGTTAAIASAVWERGGGSNSAVPALTFTGSGGWGEIAPTATGTLPLSVGTLTGTLAMATWFGNPPNPTAPTTFSPSTTYPMTCTPDSGTDTTVDSVKVYDLPAGTAYTCDITMSGGFASYGGQKVAGLVVDTNAPETLEAGDTVTPTVSYTLTLDPAFAAQFGPSPIRWMQSTLTGATTAGAATGTTAAIKSAVWERGGGSNSAVPALALTGSGSWGEVAPTATGTLPLSVGTLTGTLAMATWFAGPATPPTTFPEASTYPMTCTPKSGTNTAVDTITVVEPTLGYTCKLTFGATYTYDSSLAIHVTDVPETVTAGEEFSATVDVDLNMGSHAAGPVEKLSGDVLVDLSVGDTVTQVSIPVADATLPAMRYVGSADVTLTAPDETGAADLQVGALMGDFVTTPDLGTGPVAIPCTADEDQDQKVGSTTVEAAPVVPDGAPYACRTQNWMFPAYIDTAATLPASVKQGTTFNPGITSKITWVEDADAVAWREDVTLPSGVTWESWPASSRSTEADYKNGTGVVHTSTSGAAGSGSLAFGSLPITASGDMVWTATGSYGAVSTSTPGERSLAVGAIDLALQTKNKFTTPAYVPSAITCTLVSGQSITLGSVDVEAVPSIGLSGAKVTGTNKVGQKLTASATSTPADAAKAYQWLRNGVAISGATAATYTVVPADLAKTLSVRITATKTDFQSATATVAAGKVGAGTQKVTGKVKATGTAKVGKKLTATPGKATGATVKYQWLLNGKAIKKATGKTLKLAKSFKGKKISVKVSYVRTGYTTVTQTSSALKIKK